MFPFTPVPSPFGGAPVHSRAITAENPDGRPGGGGRTASPLGVGRKGSPCLPLPPGETLTLADIRTSGVITHVWFTVPARTEAGPHVLRDLVLRAFWDDGETPSIEVPLGDFFCNGFGELASVNSMPVIVLPTGGMNCYFPMPFRSRAVFTLSNEHPGPIDAVFFQIDYLEAEQAAPVSYFHAQWRRTPLTLPTVDHILLDDVRGRGAYVGSHIQLASLQRYWWGEGEMKFYLDGDTDFPTICGTGLEDYAGGAWAFQDVLSRGTSPRVLTYNSLYQGHPQYLTQDRSGWSPYATAGIPQHAIYRWHILDPVYFQSDIRVTVQQIGHDGRDLFERRDDVTTVAYWYQDTPRRPGGAIVPAAQRQPR